MEPIVRRGRPGQILVLFVLALVAMLAMLGLLVDGGQALALRRQFQDAGDAAALSAANGLAQSGASAGCSAATPPSAARATVDKAAKDAVHANLPSVPDSAISVSCPGGWGGNFTVQVNIDGRSPGYFAGVVGVHGFQVGTTSQAINGRIGGIRYSVVELDPTHASWPNGFMGCPSLLFSGSNTITFDGAVQVDSACVGPVGALSTNGNSATVIVNNGATISVVGTYTQGALPITPTPLSGQPYVKDPLAWLPPIPWTGPTFPVRAAASTTLNGGTRLFEPGVYVGGIHMKNSAVAYFHPGIYVMRDDASGAGGFQMGAGNKAYALPKALITTTDASWATDCVTANCGVLIYNTGMTSSAMGGGAIKDDINVGGQATLKLRPYQAAVEAASATGTGTNDIRYDNLLIWQDAAPVPSATYAQPPIVLQGGGDINLSGTLYAPSAQVQMGGTSGGAGGTPDLAATLQFVSWDLLFNGNINFHFFYQSDAFTRPTDYGLIK
jgi:Flp pilus assembly protein TadG